MVEFIVRFIQYLNKNEYNISVDRIMRFFEMLSIEDISMIKEDDILSLMKIVFCSSRLEVENISIYWKHYCNNTTSEFELERLKEIHKDLASSFISSKEKTEDKIQKINEAIHEVLKKISEENIEEKNGFTKKELKFIEENLEKINNIEFKNIQSKQFVNDCIIKHDASKILLYSEKFISNTIKEMIEKSENALKQNQIENFQFLCECYNLMKKIQNLMKKQNKALEKRMKESTKDLMQRKKDIEEDLKKKEQEHQKIQKEISDKIAELNKPLNIIQKEQAMHHREEFIGGRNTVQLIKDNTIKECITKDFKSLNQVEINLLYSYLKNNIIHFKTKMNRNINGTNHQKLDIKTTIQYACKTGGLPLNLFYEEKQRNKTQLVLVLDISGSCSIASRMMLSFMYLLQDVFGGGCSTYVFVNSLFNVSDIMKSNNIDDSINTVLNTIPTRGVYSNYYIPLKSLWEDEKKSITTDSIVIFMGDARNNKNDKGIEYVKNIARRSKSFYWLNTEIYNKWGKADSLAFDYMKFGRMFETLNVADLLYFINTMK